MSQILVSNKQYYLDEDEIELLESIRNKDGSLKFNIKYQISLN